MLQRGQPKLANYINHIALVLDASGSMGHLEREVVKVADAQIAHLAQRSKELDQETRVTVYAFDYKNNIQCLVYDKDVLRLPSISGLYWTNGATALIDATLKALDDLAKTPELYGEHGFLCYVLTDGAENDSRLKPADLSARLAGLPDNWTVAVFVPNVIGLGEAKRFGFPKDNIAIWSTDDKGLKDVGERIRQTTDYYMRSRGSGVRGYKNLFNLDLDGLNKVDVAKLVKLGPGQFRMLAVTNDEPISEFVGRKLKRPYRLGEAYYQLTKPVEVQPQKTVAIYDRKAHAVYTGADARNLLGLPSTHTVKVSPAAHANYDIFIQSTSVNRKLFSGTTLLIIS